MRSAILTVWVAMEVAGYLFHSGPCPLIMFNVALGVGFSSLIPTI
jgi:hypothetical protein